MKVIRLSEVSKRLITKVNKTFKADGANGVVEYGEDNAYPQLFERIIASSPTAKAVASTYAKFLVGQGFAAGINNEVVGKDSRGKKITVYSLLNHVARSLSYYGGAYVQCDVNLNAEVGKVKGLPFKTMRFAKLDETGYTAKIGYHNNWEKDRDKDPLKKSDVKWYNLWNPDKKAIESQVQAAGGIEAFKGQVFYMFLDDEYTYPLSPFDSVYTDCDTEAQISLHMNNESRNGFADKTLFMIGDNVKASDQETMAAEINDWMGARGEKSIVIPAPINEAGEIDEKGTLITKTIKSNIDDKLYDTYENKLANRIRKAMYALPQLLIEYETSNLGTTSGEAIVQAVNFYNEQTSSDREQVSQMFKEIFSKSANPKLRAVTDWKITPRQMNNGTTNTGATAGDQASQSE